MKNRNSPNQQDLDKLSHKDIVRFACFCARQVLPLVSKKDLAACEKAIETAEAWIRGEASEEECRVAAAAAAIAHAAAYAAAVAAVAAAAYAAAVAAAYASYAAAHAASYAAVAAADAGPDKQAMIAGQWEVYYDLLNVNENLEKAIGLESEG